MDRTTKLKKGDDDIPVQVFNGKEYRLYNGERYYSRGTKRMHVAVWEYYNGRVPKGYHVHHKDKNTANNTIENLELLSAKEHLSEHSKEMFAKPEHREWATRHLREIQELAANWHHSEEGRKWHSEHGKRVAANLRTVTKTCLWCGKEYQVKPLGTSKFCSGNCKTRYRYHHGLDNETRICECCGKPFSTNKYSSTKYCSKSCGYKCGAAKRTAKGINKKNENSAASI